jgi:hypothetical protein
VPDTEKSETIQKVKVLPNEAGRSWLVKVKAFQVEILDGKVSGPLRWKGAKGV